MQKKNLTYVNFCDNVNLLTLSQPEIQIKKNKKFYHKYYHKITLNM